VLTERPAGHQAVAGQHIEHPRRQSRLQAELGHPLHGQRRLLGRLEDHGAAGSQRWGELPAAQREREIPRHDGGDDPGRLPGHQRQLPLDRRGDLAGTLIGQLTVEA